jgi:hypothetical protein
MDPGATRHLHDLRPLLADEHQTTGREVRTGRRSGQATGHVADGLPCRAGRLDAQRDDLAVVVLDQLLTLR